MRAWYLPFLCSALGCVTTSAGRKAGPAADFPAGNDARQRAMATLRFAAPGQVRFSTTAPVHVVLLELRPTLDSVDVRLPVGADSLSPVNGVVDLVLPSETVDRLPMLAVSAPAANCTIMKGAGDDVGREFCPVSREYDRVGGRPWYFRNRVFLLMTSDPPVRPLPHAIPWAGQRTVPPVATGSRWTVLVL